MRMMGGYEDLTPGRLADGIEAIRMRAFRIIETEPGQLPQDPEWGWGLRRYVGVPLGPADLELIAQIGRAAFRRDPEIQDARVTITQEGRVAHVRAQLLTIRGPVDIERDIAV